VNILAIDTTGDHGSIALVSDAAGVIEEVNLHAPDGFAHMLFDEIDALLNRHNLEIQQMDGFAVTSGPGSFTGVRVGLTAAKGLAEATGKKVVALSNLQVLAAFGKDGLRATVIDARRGEIYGAVYASLLESTQEEVVQKLEDWLKTMPAEDIQFITQSPVLAAALADRNVIEAPQSIAGALGMIALVYFLGGRAQDPADIDANYVRRSDAELFWKEA
jgi:tRNA threonylcarbamoyladenosine biosynthesis protein TsaB